MIPRFKMNDLFFFRFTNDYWIVGKILGYAYHSKNESYVHFYVVKDSRKYCDIYTSEKLCSFPIDCKMYRDAKIIDDTDESTLLALIL